MTQEFNRILKFIVQLTLLLAIFILCMSTISGQQFSLLANSFLHGQTHFIGNTSFYNTVVDTVPYNGHYYWALGPLPAVILMPFVAIANAFHTFFYIGYLQILLLVMLLLVLVRLAHKLDYSKEDSITMALGFVLGSMFIGAAAVSTSAYFAHVIITLIEFGCIYEFYVRRRWWLIGTGVGLIATTRITATLFVIFFLLEIWSSNAKQRQKVIDTSKLLIPIAIALICLALYNYARFHSFTEQGYHYQILAPSLEKARSYGLVSLTHVPGNIFYAFFNGPLPVFRDHLSHVLKFPFFKADPWGMSIFLTSPYLFYLFTIKKKQIDQRMIRMLVTIVAIMVSVFVYYGIGFRQFGYRYALDFMPLVFVIFMIKYRENHEYITSGMRCLLIVSGALNLYLLAGMLRS